MPAGTNASLTPAPPFTLEDIRADPDEFLSVLQRCVLGGCCVEVRLWVVMVLRCAALC